jgi:uncharacterized protein (DUF952 family)
MFSHLYKIMPAALWTTATSSVPPAPIDTQDGFIHLSDPTQVRATARLHFAGQRDLVLITLDPASFAPDTLRWEPSRGGQLFPHVYGDIPIHAVIRVTPLDRMEGELVFPGDVP